ncbi:MAG TPA: DUF4180 domain-containing protein [Treponemataceae bacterium]|nr:DUF4180 domain-containing protein [Treponemataceae bacterium]
METKEHRKNGISVIELIDESVIIGETQDLLDIVSDYSIKSIILKKENISEDFFDLSTGFAGEILQKASNYRIRLGIVGDFSNVESKSLRDFIYESNLAKRIVFKPTIEEILRIFLARSA